MRVTSGEIGRYISHSSVRAVIDGAPGHHATLSCVYRGETEETTLLSSGETRRQFGCMLRVSGDSAVYAMLRWSPGDARVQIQAKINGDYDAGQPVQTIMESTSIMMSPVYGQRYVLEARLYGPLVVAYLNGEPVSVVELPPAVMDLGGTIGIRTDNANLYDVRLIGGGQ